MILNFEEFLNESKSEMLKDGDSVIIKNGEFAASPAKYLGNSDVSGRVYKG